MTTIRLAKKRNPYVCIDKTALLDQRLTWQAKGLMAYLLARPDDWTVRIKDLVNQTPNERGQGREAVQSTLKLLEDCGYIARVRVKNDQGQFTGWETIIFETPEDRQDWEGFADKRDNPSSGSTENGSTELRDNPISGLTPPLLNKERKELLNKEHTDQREQKSIDVCVVEDFENHSQRQEETGQPREREHSLTGSYQGWNSPPPLSAADYRRFIEIYNESKPSTWAIAIAHPGRLDPLRQLAKSLGGIEPTIAILKTAIARLHLSPDWYVSPNAKGQQLAQRNLDHLLRSPQGGGVPRLISYAEAAPPGLDPDAVIAAAAAGVDLQAAKRAHEYKVSGAEEEAARRAAEDEQRAHDRQSEIEAAALAEQRRRGYVA